MNTRIGFFFLCLMVMFVGCSKEFASPKDSNAEVFEALLQFAGENYALFEVKQIDWESVKASYRPKVSNSMSQDSFFSICRQAIDELKDGQSFVSNGRIPQSFNFTAGYDILFKLDVALGYIKRVNNYSIGAKGGNINDTTAYAHFYSFYDFNSYGYRDALNFLDFDKHKKIIIDLRTAYGGQPLEAFNFLQHFTSATATIGSMVHKNGRGSKDFKKVPVVIQPVSPYLGDKKIIILTNRNTFHVAAYAVAVLQELPNVTLIGQTTGPGSGIELPYELPNGWIVAVSSNYFLPANGRHIEDGIKPDIEINNTALDLQNKRDRMLERAIAQ